MLNKALLIFLLVSPFNLFSQSNKHPVVGSKFYFAPQQPGRANLVQQGEKFIFSNKVLTFEIYKENKQWFLNGRNLLTNEIVKIKNPLFEIKPHIGLAINSSDSVLGNVDSKIDIVPIIKVGMNLESNFNGKMLMLSFLDKRGNFRFEVKLSLRDGSNYLSKVVKVTALKRVKTKEMRLWSVNSDLFNPIGTVLGSPLASNSFFLTYEHPVSKIIYKSKNKILTLSKIRKMDKGDWFIDSGAIGILVPSQFRRSFNHYLERRRAAPYFQFLHYNSWYDIAWYERPFSADECVDVIQGWKNNFIDPYNIKMDSFVLDDGWDDYEKVWEFHPTRFPDGFTPLNKLANKFGSGIGVWISPAGGYLGEQTKRLEAGKKMGLAQNSSGFEMSKKSYYDYFKNICINMIEKYNINYFKFDRLAGDFGEEQMLEDKEASLRLAVELREYNPELFINITVGTWPSPFWLMHGDSTWRGGGGDVDLWGKGNNNQKWLNFRDGATYNGVISRAPWYPVSSLMIIGIVYADLGLAADLDGDIIDWERQVKSYFASGVNLQEMYINYRLLKPEHWSILAKWAKWSKAREDLFADSHWVGGNPNKNEIYGWASWNGERATLALRNPDDRKTTINIKLKDVLELPEIQNGSYYLIETKLNENGENIGKQRVKLRFDEEYSIEIDAFEVMVFDIIALTS